MASLVNIVLAQTGPWMLHMQRRWEQESWYEDWDQFEFTIKRKVNTITGVEFIELRELPFGFRWRSPDGLEWVTKVIEDRVITVRISKPLSVSA
jgi:hypothetical protein